MSLARTIQGNGRLLHGLLILYLAASLVHFTHNAEYLSDYPNLPLSMTRAGVYLAWCGQTLVGILGYLLYRSRWRLSGLILLGIYSAFGLGGLLHYTRAPFGMHTAAMNFTIWFEVVAAALLLTSVLTLAANRRRDELPEQPRR